MTHIFFTACYVLLNVLSAIIVLYVIVENFDQYRGSSGTRTWVKWLRIITKPLLYPFQLLLPARLTKGWDLSPLFVLLILALLRSFFTGMR